MAAKAHFAYWLFKDAKTGLKNAKILEENIGKTLSDIHHSRILYDPPPRILEIKAKINKWDLWRNVYLVLWPIF